MALGARNGIPVPRQQQTSRPQQVTRPRNSASGGAGPAAPSRGARRGSTHARAAAAAAAAEGTQAPWRSSLDLVWSYSRSQAFYGANIATSPSFVEHQWAGPSGGVDSSVEEEEDEDESDVEATDDFDEDGDDDDDDDEDLQRSAYSLNYATRPRPPQANSRYGAVGANADDDLVAASPAAPMDWQDEQLPPNAYQRSQASRNRLLGRRDKRQVSARSPRDPNRRALDQRLRRVAANDDDDEERSRSRSRSPKRVNLSRPSVSHLHSSSTGGYESAEEEMTSGNGLAAKKPSVGFLPSERPSEATPLLRRARDAQANGDIESTDEHPGARLGRLHTPSWLRHSHMSTSSSKFRMQGYGTSTFWQSWFNTVNALVGVGILSLPLAISYAGLIPGLVLFLLCGLVTNYTGKVLAHIMAAEPSLRTYADIGNRAFGPKARLLVSFFFCLELWAVSTALVILFGDSVRAMIISSVDHTRSGMASHILATMAEWPVAAFKAFGVLFVLPTMFLPLRWLSPVSVIGIISVVTLFSVVLADGLIKPEAPGSLRDPIPPALGPQWMRLPLSFGLIMSGFSSHPIIPSLFKDMRNPKQFRLMLNWAYVGATIIYLGMGLIGYLMFGREVSDEITRNLAHTKGYPRVLNKVALCLIIINPLSKFALAARPVVTTIELLLGVEQSQIGGNKGTGSPGPPQSPLAQKMQVASDPIAGLQNEPSSSAFSLPPPAAAIDSSGRIHGDEDGNAQHLYTTISMPGADEMSVSARTAQGGPESSPLIGSAVSLRAAERTARWPRRRKVALRSVVQLTVTLLIGITAIVLPGFEKVMAFLGAFLACATCIFGPLLAHMRLFRHEMSRARLALDIGILLVSVVVAALGTVWTFLPLR